MVDNMNEVTEFKILSIDAWRDECGWTWNQWFKVGTIDREVFETLTTTRKILKFFRDEGFLSEGSQGRVAIEDDGYNIVAVDRNTFEPLFAIEYGGY